MITTGKKPPSSRTKMTVNLLMALVILAELFIMFFMSFPRLDDLTWGGVIGIQRLNTCFAGYNGRYVGNLIVIVLMRLPAAVRAGMELAVLCVLFYYVHRLLPKRGSVCFFALALLGIPLPVYAQSVVWTAGFSNYATSAVIMLFVIDTYYRVIICDRDLPIRAHLIFVIVSFAGQLILENTTLYTTILSVFFLGYGLLGKRKLYAPALTGLAADVCGAALMFSNSSYHSALVKDGGNYKEISISISGLWQTYQNDVVPHLIKNNHLINIGLTAALVLLWATAQNKEKPGIRLKKCGSFFGSALVAFFIYDAMDDAITQAMDYGAAIYAVVTFLYAAYILFTISITITDKMQKSALLIFACSQVILTVPLLAAAPLSARCFFQNGILWCMMFGYIMQVLLERFGLDTDRDAIRSRLAVITQVVCALYIACMLCGQALSWQIQRIRTDITQTGVANGAEMIILPEVPWSGRYCFGANGYSSDYWLSNYKDYYGIPSDTELKFIDYYKWRADYSAKRSPKAP